MRLSEVIRHGQQKIVRSITHSVINPAYIAVDGLRSLSDSGYYPKVALQAAQSTRVFGRFKRNPIYREVLEHVSEKQGAEYLEQIQKKWPQLIDNIEEYKINDAVGDPIRYIYPRVGEISPTTLRYLKVASDLRELFGELTDFNVVEIGAGYGGQFLISDLLWRLGSWTILDLDPVLQLISRYLECHLINSIYKPTTLNRYGGQDAAFDLAISNYAFSELPKQLQLKYISKVLSKTKRGYMHMNSGKTSSNSQHLSINELRAHFPTAMLLDEEPLTYAENYIFVWGQ
jgi:hypothetical protein